MAHAKTNRAVFPHEVAGNTTRFALGKGFELGIDVWHDFSLTMKSSQLPVVVELTYQEDPRGVIMSTETRMNLPIEPAAIARSKSPRAPFWSNSAR